MSGVMTMKVYAVVRSGYETLQPPSIGLGALSVTKTVVASYPTYEAAKSRLSSQLPDGGYYSIEVYELNLSAVWVVTYTSFLGDATDIEASFPTEMEAQAWVRANPKHDGGKYRVRMVPFRG